MEVAQAMVTIPVFLPPIPEPSGLLLPALAIVGTAGLARYHN